VIVIAISLGAIGTVHIPHGFFMNWLGGQPGEGIEYHLLAIGLGIVCLANGGGKVSIDHALMLRQRRRAADLTV
jgi:putative oxidoreductase